MKASDPSAYSEIYAVTAGTSGNPALGKAFRGIIISDSVAGAKVFTITSLAGVVTSGVTFFNIANQTLFIPIAGKDITCTTGTGTAKVYAVI
jgi:hypothetical protein